ncbi:MAG: hypothetical protein JRM80_10135 [Nitrososphaerota archaeon]|nr:hypothetical protein [Nitrososphaerota archaeon]
MAGLTVRNGFFSLKIAFLLVATLLFLSSIVDLAYSDTSYCLAHSGSPYCETIGPNGFLLQGTVNINDVMTSAVWGGLLTVAVLLVDVVEHLTEK